MSPGLRRAVFCGSLLNDSERGGKMNQQKNDLAAQVVMATGDTNFGSDVIDAIVDDLIHNYDNLTNIDDVPSEDFWSIVARHDPS